MAIDGLLIDAAFIATPAGFDKPKRRKGKEMTTASTVRRAKDVPEGSFVKVLDDVPDSELTVGDEGIVQDTPEGKFLITEEIDIPLPLSPSTPLEIISANVDPRPAVTPVRSPEEFQQEFEAEFGSGVPTEEISAEDQQPLSEDEEAEMTELFDMPEEEMSLATQTRLSRLGARARQFGMAAGSFGRGAFNLGAATGEVIQQKIEVERSPIVKLQDEVEKLQDKIRRKSF